MAFASSATANVTRPAVSDERTVRPTRTSAGCAEAMLARRVSRSTSRRAPAPAADRATVPRTERPCAPAATLTAVRRCRAAARWRPRRFLGRAHLRPGVRWAAGSPALRAPGEASCQSSWRCSRRSPNRTWRGRGRCSRSCTHRPSETCSCRTPPRADPSRRYSRVAPRSRHPACPRSGATPCEPSIRSR